MLLALGAISSLPAQAPATASFNALLRRAIRHEDPAVRGEAALALAAAVKTQGLQALDGDLEALRKIAAEPKPLAHVPAILALGLIAPTGVEVTLGELFEQDAPSRRQAVAFAFGCLPDSLPTPTFDDFLAAVPGGSYSRNRAVLNAWLAGVACSAGHHSEESPAGRHQTTLRFLIEDVANRDSSIRVFAASALYAIDHVLDPELVETLRSSKQASTQALGIELTEPGALDNLELRSRFTRIARRDRSSKVRAAALHTLIDARAFSVLELAARAIASEDGAEVAAGVRIILSYGGHRQRRDLEAATQERTPAERQRILDGWDGPISPSFGKALLADGLDRELPIELRASALQLCANAGEPRARKAILALLAKTDLPALRSRLLQSLFRYGEAERHLNSEDGIGSAEWIQAACAVDPATGASALAEAIGSLEPSELTGCLAAWRRATLPLLGPPLTTRRAMLPPHVEHFLAPL